MTISATVAITLGLRLAAIGWNLRLPVSAWVDWPTHRAPTDEDDDVPTDSLAPRERSDRVRFLRRRRRE